MFERILIANRGEIACRIIRTAHAMGIKTVAVYSEADAWGPHVAAADQGYLLGPAPARDSYLRGDRIIAAAKTSGAQAIHPGYGFLAENAAFAEACAAAGLVFIGPPASAIRAMGGKSEAKALMEAAGVPVVPGYHGDAQDNATLADQAKRLGFPLLIKPSAGGGGKGMRVVADAGRLAAQLAAARREAQAAFGDAKLLLERYLARPRHVEVQVFADSFGNCLHLSERDCSIQRRHQKVVEEAPAPGLSPELRARLGEAAVAAAKAIGYRGAGTVEFLVDGDRFFFMEMNTRLQVEHAVTELVTGIDLVEWQLRVAAGERLPCAQDAVMVRGHAIEARLYAEAPEREFLPATGRLQHLSFPPEDGAQVRIDSGVRTGDLITPHYDPLLAKLIIWGASREQAVTRLCQALAATQVAGVATNLAFLAAIAAHPAFAAGDLDTGFIPRHLPELLPDPEDPSDTVLGLACLGVLLARQAQAEQAAAASADPHSPWGLATGWRLNGPAAEVIRFREAQVPATALADGWQLSLPGGPVTARGRLEAGRLEAELGPLRCKAGFARHGDAVTLVVDGRVHPLTQVSALPAEAPEPPETGLAAPMPGTVTAVLVEPGAKVAKGQPLVVMEAMKMEHTLAAPAEGVARVLVPVGAMVEDGTLLVDFQAQEKAP